MIVLGGEEISEGINLESRSIIFHFFTVTGAVVFARKSLDCVAIDSLHWRPTGRSGQTILERRISHIASHRHFNSRWPARAAFHFCRRSPTTRN